MNGMIYLDNAATSFPRPETVYQEMDRVNRTLSVNAGRGGYKAAHDPGLFLIQKRCLRNSCIAREKRMLY